MQTAQTIVDTLDYDVVVNKMREFFRMKGFKEACTQNRFSILAACEDPTTIVDYQYKGETWPLPQTGQMWLEWELLKQKYPDIPGYYCLTTSYRQEPNPVEGRHDLVFPLFEFEIKGGIEALVKFEMELLEHLGYGETFPRVNYLDMCKKYGVDELDHDHEEQLYKDYGPVVFLENFPMNTSPFWNMRKDKDSATANKVDVIISGVETFGSAERSCDPEVMRELFHTISDGQYAQTIIDKFGKERTLGELEKFLEFDFFERSGGGIGVTRLIKSMEKEGLLEKLKKN